MSLSEHRRHAPLIFDRSTGRLDGASLAEHWAAVAMKAGARLTEPFAHRGFSLGCRALAVTHPSREAVVWLNDDARFAFPFGDGYWSVLLDPRFVYEPEIAAFLTGVADVDYTFVDGGANYGLWSVLVTSRPYGRHRAIAIEASSRNVAKLRRNAELNDDRFAVRHQAISDVAGARVRLSGQRHESFTILDRDDSEHSEEVTTVSLDSLIDEGAIAATGKLVVKLDVEGVEIAALKGARRLLAADTVMVVEEHGADPTHAVTRHVLAEPGLREFVLDPATNRFEEVRDPAALDPIKTNPAVGYNVFVTSSAFWVDRLGRITID